MSISTEQVRSIASQTRNDFEKGLISDDEIIEAAVAFNAVSNIATYARSTEGRADRRQIGLYVVKIPLAIPDRFPKGHCDMASIVLKQRLDADGVLEGRSAELIEGGYGEDRSAMDVTSSYQNYHAFLGIGSTELGQDTIVDITADQFNPNEEPVYVGPIRNPWTRHPRIEQYEY